MYIICSGLSTGLMSVGLDCAARRVGRAVVRRVAPFASPELPPSPESLERRVARMVFASLLQVCSRGWSVETARSLMVEAGARALESAVVQLPAAVIRRYAPFAPQEMSLAPVWMERLQSDPIVQKALQSLGVFVVAEDMIKRLNNAQGAGRVFPGMPALSLQQIILAEGIVSAVAAALDPEESGPVAGLRALVVDQEALLAFSLEYCGPAALIVHTIFHEAVREGWAYLQASPQSDEAFPLPQQPVERTRIKFPIH
jgi:hypothetical protein